MAKQISVGELYKHCRKMLADQWGYIYGQSGTMWTAEKQAKATGNMTVEYGAQWIGHMVADCSGVFVYIYRQYGVQIEHSSNAIARKYAGVLERVPQPGWAAFKWRKDGAPSRWEDGLGDFYHIGIVDETGKNVYEAKSTRSGFTTSRTGEWDWFAPLNAVDYQKQEENPVATYKAVVTTDKVNVRKAASKSSASLGKVNTGDIATVSGESNGWLKCQIKGMNGYVYGQYLRKVVEPATDDTVTLALPKELAVHLLALLEEAVNAES